MKGNESYKIGNLSKEKIKGVIEIYDIRLCAIEIKISDKAYLNKSRLCAGEIKISKQT